jgi:hypothetical protein
LETHDRLLLELVIVYAARAQQTTFFVVFPARRKIAEAFRTFHSFRFHIFRLFGALFISSILFCLKWRNKKRETSNCLKSLIFEAKLRFALLASLKK